ncbi:MAG: hypothetical protein AB1810_04640 [Pseudomonadota bacterium]
MTSKYAWLRAVALVAVQCAPAIATAQQDKPLDQYLDDTHRRLSDAFLAIPNGIDSFFATTRAEEESNASLMRLSLEPTLNKGNEWSFVARVRVKLVLPHTEKRLRLILESTPEEALQEPTEGLRGEPSPLDAVKSTEQTAAIQALLRETRRWRVNLSSGIKLHTPIDPFVRLRAWGTIPLEQWQIRLTETVFWYDSVGFGQTTRVDFERPLDEDMLFRASSQATWHRDDDILHLSQDLNLFYRHSQDRAIAYRLAAIGIDEPSTHVTDYVFDMRYRVRTWRDWLFFEIGPRLHYPKAADFDLTPSLNFKLEAIFGNHGKPLDILG